MSAFVFRGYDQDELNHQMNARGTVPDIAPFVATYASESARCRASLPCHIGVPYGTKPDERLDIFPSAGTAGPAPVFVFIHGGYWRALDAADSSFMAETFTRAGACVVAVNYGLAPSTPLREIVRQCRAAIAWVAVNIARYGGDPGRLHVSGSSAGAHLAAAVLSPNWQTEAGLPAGVIQSASLMSGLYDLEPVQKANCNDWLGLDPQDALDLSPLRFLPARPLPLTVAYAPNETAEFKRQSEVYAAACIALGCPTTLMVPPGVNHYDLPLQLMDRSLPLTRAVLATMGL